MSYPASNQATTIPAKPRRILIFSHAYYPYLVGGAEVAVKEITDRIAPSELEFEMITINAGGEEPEGRVGNVKVHRVFRKFGIAQKLLFPLVAARRAIKLHRERPYDAVWAIMASYAGFAAFLFKKKVSARSSGGTAVPMVLTIQEGDHFERRHGVFGPAFRKIFAAADRITAISRYLEDWSRDMGAKCPIDIVPNAVDIDAFTKPLDPADRKSLRSSMGITDTDVVLVTASRLVHKNASEDIIGALKFLDPQVKLLILGTGPDEAMLRGVVAKEKLEGRVIFKGFVQHAELPRHLKSSEIFVRPSRTEGLGNSFLEAMAAEIPVIATSVGGIPDFLTEGETGLFCDVDSPQSIAQKVEKLMKDRESREYIVRSARKMVEERYGWDRVAPMLERALRAVFK